jgi:hypothetical protein
MTSVTIFYVFFGLVAAWMLFKIIKHRGFKGAMFGAVVRELSSEMELESRGIIKTTLKVHVLEPHEADRGPHVGVEIVHASFGSWEMHPISLTRTEAQRLSEQLAQAAKESAVRPRMPP